jgi:hypothetical protein
VGGRRIGAAGGTSRLGVLAWPPHVCPSCVAFWFLLARQMGAWQLGDVPVVVAVILAAQGTTWRRKLAFASVTVSLVALAFGFFALFHLASPIPPTDPSLMTDMQYAGFFGSNMGLRLLLLGAPLVMMLALFVGRRPSMLWTRERA